MPMPYILILNTQGYSPNPTVINQESDSVAFIWPAVVIAILKLRALGSRTLDKAESLFITIFSCVESFGVDVSQLTNPPLKILSNSYQCTFRKRRKHSELLFGFQGVHSILL